MIVGSAWASALYSGFQGQGFQGSGLLDFANVIGNGSASHVIGKSFTTQDTGTTPGVGIGSGNGLSGFTANDISNSIYVKAISSFGQAGAKLKDICDIIGNICASQLGMAVLTSNHNPVFAGVGNVVIGSIAVDGDAWGSLIQSQGEAVSFLGSKWPDFALAIGQGQAEQIKLMGTGTVSIAGSPTGTPTVPGAGSGSGVIS